MQRDAAVIWHPYTQHRQPLPVLPIASAEGVYLYDDQGRSYIDAISSWWTNIHGHAHPYLAEHISRQAGKLDHVLFAGCTHEPAVRLAERLLTVLPGNFERVFYSDNGSTAVEVALKMAIQFQQQTPHGQKRTKILALQHAYHGDTFGAMSVSERGIFTMAFADFLFEVVFINPADQEAIKDLPLEEFACFIYEPLVQGAGGMMMYDKQLLADLLPVLKQHGIVCIADEVMTGFGRTGRLFASEYLDTYPDIICLSKGISGGCLPLAATMCTREIFNVFLSDDRLHTFFHGHSYTANPIACAAGLASLDLLEQPSCMDQIKMISDVNSQFVHQLVQENEVTNPRSLGTICAFELKASEHGYLSEVKEKIISFSLEQGVLLRPLGNTLYSMPPYCITEEEMMKVFGVMEEAARKL